MNEYRITSTGGVVSDYTLRTIHYPELMLPEVLTTDMLLYLGAEPILQSPTPIAPEGQVSIRNGIVQDSLGNWVHAWSFVDAPPTTVYVPQSVTRRQARQALLLSNKLHLVQLAIDAIPNELQRQLVQIEWDDSQEFDRTRPIVISIGEAIGLDATALDEIFILASTL